MRPEFFVSYFLQWDTETTKPRLAELRERKLLQLASLESESNCRLAACLFRRRGAAGRSAEDLSPSATDPGADWRACLQWPSKPRTLGRLLLRLALCARHSGLLTRFSPLDTPRFRISLWHLPVSLTGLPCWLSKANPVWPAARRSMLPSLPGSTLRILQADL